MADLLADERREAERLGRLSISRFAAVLRDLGEDTLAAAVEGRALDASTLEREGDRLVQATSIVFQLLTLAEDVALLRAEASRATWRDAPSSTLRSALGELATSGAAAVDEALGRTSVEIVLTAHPTEARRATVLELHARLRALVATEVHPGDTAAQRRLEARLDAELELLWRSGEILLQKPDVATERRHVVRHLVEVFTPALAQLDEAVRDAWAEALPDAPAPTSLPRVTFGSWVGGDRDGHPFVTAEVTRETLAMHRAAALDLHDRTLSGLASTLGLSGRSHRAPPELSERTAAAVTALGPRGARAASRNPEEPWRTWVNLVRERLGATRDAVATPIGYGSAAELDGDLAVLERSLVAVGGARLARAYVAPVRRQVQAFGFHLAALDVRQNSAVHDRAMIQILAAAGRPDVAFDGWDEASRVAFLDAELRSDAPLVTSSEGLPPEARGVLEAYAVVADEVRRHGPDALGDLIVSMTRAPSDLLVVHLFARLAGLAVREDGVWASPLPVVPLFETIDDLERSADVLGHLLEHPATGVALRARAARTGADPAQPVMVGYSDSNKDGGIVASLWHVHQAQGAMLEVARARGLGVQFFHGRGGTISRGAGPDHRFVRALPAGGADAGLRLTQQGEVLAQKYATPWAAARSLETFVAGVGRRVAPGRAESSSAAAGRDPTGALDLLARSSRAAYEALVNTEGFLRFFREATPIDAIEGSRIGSRPARRTGQASLADLRAIPWVFAWSQARFHLTGWFGFGTALRELGATRPGELARVRASFQAWPPLHYVVSNVATSVALVDRDVLATYADLVDDVALRERILAVITAELDATTAALEELYGGPLDERRPRVGLRIARRKDRLRGIHAHQVHLLRAMRAARARGDEAASEALLLRALGTVNAIASGLGATG